MRLLAARGLISGAAIDLEHVLSRDDGASFDVCFEQRADWMIGELEHAIKQLKEARK